MRVSQGMTPRLGAENRTPEAEITNDATDAHAPRKLNFAENVMLTIKRMHQRTR